MQSHIAQKVSILLRLVLSLILVLFLFAPGVEAYGIGSESTDRPSLYGGGETLYPEQSSGEREQSSLAQENQHYTLDGQSDVAGEPGEIHYIQYFSDGEIPEDCPVDIIESRPSGNSDIQSRSLVSFVTKKLNYYLGKSALWSSGKKMFVECATAMIMMGGVPAVTAVYEAEMMFARYEPIIMEYCLSADDAAYIITDTAMVAAQRGITLDKFEPLLLENASKAASTGTTLSGAAGGYMEQAFIMCAQNGMIPAAFFNTFPELASWLANQLLGENYDVMPDSPFAPSAPIPIKSDGFLNIRNIQLPLKMVDGSITGITKAYSYDSMTGKDLPAPIDINPSYQWVYEGHLFCIQITDKVDYIKWYFKSSSDSLSLHNDGYSCPYFIWSAKDNCWMSPYCTRARLNGIYDIFSNANPFPWPPSLVSSNILYTSDVYMSSNLSYKISSRDSSYRDTLYAEYTPATGWHSVIDGMYHPVDVPITGGHTDVPMEWTGNDATYAPDGSLIDAGNINMNIPTENINNWGDFIDNIQGKPIPNPNPPAPKPDPKPDPAPNPDAGKQIDDFNIGDLTKVFPFCIPFDLYFLLATFAASPITPCFDWHFSFPGIGEYDFTIDLAPFDSVAATLRLVEKIAFCVGLVLVTRDLIRG